MKTMLKLAAVLFLSITTGAWAADSVTQILDRHVAAMKKGDLEGVMADYADDVVAIAPHGVAPGQKPAGVSDVFAGKQNVRKLFSVLTDKDHVGANRTMISRYEPRGGDVTLMYWEQNRGTPQQVSGVDIFVVRDGKIEFQDVTINPAGR